jgi:hypothetical protein
MTANNDWSKLWLLYPVRRSRTKCSLTLDSPTSKLLDKFALPVAVSISVGGFFLSPRSLNKRNKRCNRCIRYLQMMLEIHTGRKSSRNRKNSRNGRNRTPRTSKRSLSTQNRRSNMMHVPDVLSCYTNESRPDSSCLVNPTRAASIMTKALRS